MRTNIIFHYIHALGEKEIAEAIVRGRSYEAQKRMVPITNPILRFFMFATEIKGKKIHMNRKVRVPHDDYVRFNYVGSLLKVLSDEIDSNSRFKNELRRNLLGFNEGQAHRSISELAAGAYYKNNDFAVEMSPVQPGYPDVLLPDVPYASDVKIFPDGKLQLKAAVNESREAIENCFGDVGDGHIVIMLFTPSKSKIVTSLGLLQQELAKDEFSHYRDDNIVAMVVGDQYPAGDVQYDVVTNNLRLHFQASWPMDQPVNELKEKLLKSVEQSQNADKSAISWVMVIGDANRYAMVAQLLRHIVKIDEFVSETEGLEGLVVFSVEPSNEQGKRGVLTVADVYGRAPRELDITNDSVTEFLQNMSTAKEVLIP